MGEMYCVLWQAEPFYLFLTSVLFGATESGCVQLNVLVAILEASTSA